MSNSYNRYCVYRIEIDRTEFQNMRLKPLKILFSHAWTCLEILVFINNTISYILGNNELFLCIF